jgi:glutathione S-transferase
MAELEILGAPQSNYVWVCRIACEEKGVPYGLVPLMPHTPDIDAAHPLGKIPAMRHGDVVLAESRAICAYVDRAFAGPPLVPTDPVAGAQTEQWISIVNTAIDPVMVRQFLGAHFFPGTPDGSPNRPVIDAALPKMAQQMAVLDRAVAPTGHLVGDGFTLADANLLPILFYLSKLDESAALLNKAPAVKAYLARHLARPSLQATLPPPMPKR